MQQDRRQGTAFFLGKKKTFILFYATTGSRRVGFMILNRILSTSVGPAMIGHFDRSCALSRLTRTEEENDFRSYAYELSGGNFLEVGFLKFQPMASNGIRSLTSIRVPSDKLANRSARRRRSLSPLSSRWCVYVYKLVFN